LVTFAATYGLRGIYFALLEETRVPSHTTGTAVGVISVVGFTPEIFFASIAGRILDYSPGVAGHQNFFAFLAVIAVVGVGAALVLGRMVGRQHRPDSSLTQNGVRPGASQQEESP
jgi:hypothetical protein